ncbi:uncharacterized protein LOC141612930 [Silene latifolia]|uniref:uncharacterized protein LOC141612930 n=1 Tax=Silene latifolia TaxID=37657 RepID=UPI003D76D071
MWNKALVGKLVDWIAAKKDSLWVKWVHQIYIRDKNWHEYTPSNDSSWAWRKICKTRDDLAAAYTNGKWCFEGGVYTAKGCYMWLRGQHPRARWAKMIWNPWSIPKHIIFTWLILNDSLNTKAKLKRLGICDEAVCCLCAQDEETQLHLFSRCTISKMVFAEINKRLNLNIPREYLELGLSEEGRRCGGDPMMVIMAGMYHIWYLRNKARLEGILERPEITATRVVKEIRSRIQARIKFPLTIKDQKWYDDRFLQ